MQYLLKFADNTAYSLASFWKAEFNALIKLHKLSITVLNEDFSTPFVIVESDFVDHINMYLKRTFLCKYAIHIWKYNKHYDAFLEDLSINHEKELYYVNNFPSYKIHVSYFNKKLLMKDRLKYIDEILDVFPIDSKVDLKSPKCVLYLCLRRARPSEVFESSVFFGPLVGYGQRTVVDMFSLKTRFFIGNTTMDPMLAFVMCNIAGVKHNDLVLDPFCGTGGILLSCAHFGAHVLGAELDGRLLHGLTKSTRVDVPKKRATDENVRSNFINHELDSYFVDVLSNNFIHNLWRPECIFDVILLDPPYGIREGPRNLKKWYINDGDNKFLPVFSEYKLSSLFLDVLNFAGRYLVLGGTLVFWLPTLQEDFIPDTHIPRLDCLELYADCEQPLSANASRHLLAFRKTTEWKDSMSAYFISDYYEGNIRYRDRYLAPKPKMYSEYKSFIS